MPVFAYKGVTATGRSTKGWLDADSARGARTKLRHEGIFLTDLSEAGDAPESSDTGLRLQLPWFRRVPSMELSIFTRQAATLISAGIPLVEGLAALKERCEVTLFSDSQYVVASKDQGWAKRWRINGWRRNKKKEKALNVDMWEALLDLDSKHEVGYEWVKGHAGDPENERCDLLATTAASVAATSVDAGYEAVRGSHTAG